VRAYSGCLGAEPSAGSKGRAHGQGSGGELKHLAFPTSSGTCKFAHLSEIWKCIKVTDICVVLAKMNLISHNTSQINVN